MFLLLLMLIRLSPSSTTDYRLRHVQVGQASQVLQIAARSVCRRGNSHTRKIRAAGSSSARALFCPLFRNSVLHRTGGDPGSLLRALRHVVAGSGQNTSSQSRASVAASFPPLTDNRHCSSLFLGDVCHAVRLPAIPRRGRCRHLPPHPGWIRPDHQEGLQGALPGGEENRNLENRD
jgi:hypothetical protein